MDGVYFELADGAIYHNSKMPKTMIEWRNSYLSHLDKMATHIWLVEQGNWLVLKNTEDKPYSRFCLLSDAYKAEIIAMAQEV